MYLQEEATCRVFIWTHKGDNEVLIHDTQHYLAGHAYQVIDMHVMEEVRTPPLQEGLSLYVGWVCHRLSHIKGMSALAGRSRLPSHRHARHAGGNHPSPWQSPQRGAVIDSEGFYLTQGRAPHPRCVMKY
jgi:hypothetical protein